MNISRFYECVESENISPAFGSTTHADYSLNVYRKASNFIFISLKLSAPTPDLFDFNFCFARARILPLLAYVALCVELVDKACVQRNSKIDFH